MTIDHSHEQQVDIRVEDNGDGIDEGVELFSPFTTTKSSGLGLGLSVSRSLARNHGGGLYVVSDGRATDRSRPVSCCACYARSSPQPESSPRTPCKSTRRVKQAHENRQAETIGRIGGQYDTDRVRVVAGQGHAEKCAIDPRRDSQ